MSRELELVFSIELKPWLGLSNPSFVVNRAPNLTSSLTQT